MFNITQTKMEAKARMKGNYGYALLAMILLALIQVGGAFALGAGAIVVAGAVQCCRVSMYLDIATGQYKGVDSLYGGFKHFWTAFKATLWELLLFGGIMAVAVIVGLIFTLIFAIGGYLLGDVYWLGIVFMVPLMIVACITIFCFAIRLQFVYHIMVNKPGLAALDCLKESWKITKGQFFSILVYHLSFILWWIGTAWTNGILGLRFFPYKNTADALLYLQLSNPQPGFNAYNQGNQYGGNYGQNNNNYYGQRQCQPYGQPNQGQSYQQPYGQNQPCPNQGQGTSNHQSHGQDHKPPDLPKEEPPKQE